MPKPTDLHAARERKNVAEHDAVYGAVRNDAERLYSHFLAREDTTSTSAAILTFAVMLALPEEEPYD